MGRVSIAYAAMIVAALALLAFGGAIIYLLVARDDMLEGLSDIHTKYFLLLLSLSSLFASATLLYWALYEPTEARAALGMFRVFLCAFSCVTIVPPVIFGLQSLSLKIEGVGGLNADWRDPINGSLSFIIVTGLLSLWSYRDYREAKRFERAPPRRRKRSQ